MDMKPVYLPPKKNYSLDALKESNYPAWERVQRLLDSLQQDLFGQEESQIFYADLQMLVNGGFLYPEVTFDPETDDAVIRFLMWSYLSKNYKYIDDLEDDEFDVVSGMLEYFARTN